MTDYTFPPASPAIVSTTDGRHFPVRRIFCVGKNYADHVKEMGGAPGDTPPVFFTKPADAVICPTADRPGVPFPPATQNLHYEAELVLALKSGGEKITEAAAAQHVFGLALGCDLTRRDLQKQAKDAGNPWDIAKGFDHSAVMGPIVPDLPLNNDLGFTLSVNGEEKQRGVAGDMIFSAPRIIADLSNLFELKAGDLIYTGTTEGVGPLVTGDRIEITSEALPTLTFEMT